MYWLRHRIRCEQPRSIHLDQSLENVERKLGDIVVHLILRGIHSLLLYVDYPGIPVNLIPAFVFILQLLCDLWFQAPWRRGCWYASFLLEALLGHCSRISEEKVANILWRGCIFAIIWSFRSEKNLLWTRLFPCSFWEGWFWLCHGFYWENVVSTFVEVGGNFILVDFGLPDLYSLRPIWRVRSSSVSCPI